MAPEQEIQPAKAVLNKWLYKLSPCQKDIYLYMVTLNMVLAINFS